jgi:hypothetical protein
MSSAVPMNPQHADAGLASTSQTPAETSVSQFPHGQLTATPWSGWWDQQPLE